MSWTTSFGISENKFSGSRGSVADEPALSIYRMTNDEGSSCSFVVMDESCEVNAKVVSYLANFNFRPFSDVVTDISSLPSATQAYHNDIRVTCRMSCHKRLRKRGPEVSPSRLSQV